MSNTTSIEKCHIGEDVELTVKLAKEKGWSKFSVYPNGNLIGTSPEGIADKSVPNFARILCDAAPDLLAVLESYICWHDGDESDETMKKWLDVVGIPAMRAAIAKAKGE